MYLNIHENNRRMLLPRIAHGDFCVDATAGRGNDTLFLAECVGPEGRVLALDYQREALASTALRLQEHRLRDRVQLIQADHAHLSNYLDQPVRAILFNFGYLPAGDHALRTSIESSAPAVQAALLHLMPGGLLSMVLYRDGEQGALEYDALRYWAARLPSKYYGVLEMHMSNMPNHPPLQIFIERLA